MAPREQFDRELKTLRDDVIRMGLLVDEQVKLALRAVETLDLDLAHQVVALDREVNASRYSIEQECFRLIVTQQPAARDLRAIIAAMNIIVDLERIGDKSKAIANTLPAIMERPHHHQMPELDRMGNLVRGMISLCMKAYAEDVTQLAEQISDQSKELTAMLSDLAAKTIENFAKAKKEKKVAATFGTLRVAQHLDRMGDLATNIAERIIYISTGNVQEMKTHQDDTDD